MYFEKALHFISIIHKELYLNQHLMLDKQTKYFY